MTAPPDWLLFVETTIFTKRVVALQLEESLRRLQQELARNPEAGDVEPGTGGLRKVRLADPERGKGKRGGARVHYLWHEHARTIHLMFVYAKHERTTLNPEQKAQLRRMAMQIRQQAR